MTQSSKPSQRIAHLSPCGDALDWLDSQSSAAAAWRTCDRGDWMLWLLGRLASKPGSRSRKRLVLAACECARTALQYVPDGEARPLRAISTAEAWARGEGTTLVEVCAAAANAAANAATAAAYAAANAGAAAYAGASAANAAYVAYDANAADDVAADVANAASSAAVAAYVAYDAVAADVANAASSAAVARAGVLAKCADIVRKHYPKPPRIRKSLR